jgi:hypothetical protein
MAEEEQEKQSIERAIVRARDGVGDRIDELDRHLRENLNPKTMAKNYAPQIVAGGAVVGILIGFGVPKVFRRIITWGVPIALVAVAVKNRRNHHDESPSLLVS